MLTRFATAAVVIASSYGAWRGQEAGDEFSRDVWTQHSDELAELYRFRFALCAATAPERVTS